MIDIQRLDRERDSLPNQLAVIGYLKLQRIQRHVLFDRDADAIVYAAKKAVWQDINVKAMDAAIDFLLSSKWSQ